MVLAQHELSPPITCANMRIIINSFKWIQLFASVHNLLIANYISGTFSTFFMSIII